LHREFHHGPDVAQETPQIEAKPEAPAVAAVEGDIPRNLGDPDPNPGVVTEQKDTETPSVPPESTFVKLAPSKNRYTLLKDEL